MQPAPQRRVRLGWLGPAIVLLGVVAAGLGIWFMVAARPEPGAVIDTIRIDDHRAFVVRAEDGGDGDRAFVELRTGDHLDWRALVPTYGGRPGAPGLAWSESAVSIRVLRDGRAEVFALAMHDASKIGGFKLSPDKGPVVPATTGPVTMTDHQRSYEVVAGHDWHQLVAVDLATGVGLWKQELGAAAVVDGGVDGEVVWIQQGDTRRGFRVRDGAEAPAPASVHSSAR
ncbi:MAG: hypothetical protein ACTHU0_35330 [Kofleriaceae bacterium]